MERIYIYKFSDEAQTNGGAACGFGCDGVFCTGEGGIACFTDPGENLGSYRCSMP